MPCFSSCIPHFVVQTLEVAHRQCEELRRKNRLERAPIKEVFRTSLRPMLCAWGARLGDNSLAYIYESFVIVYVTQQLHLARDVIVTALMFSTAAQLITVPLFGWVSDKIGRRPVYMLGAVLSGLAVFPFFTMLQTKDLVFIYALSSWFRRLRKR